MFTPRLAQLDCEVSHAFFNSPVPAAICVYLLILGSAACVRFIERIADNAYDGSKDLPGLDLKSITEFQSRPTVAPLPAMAHIGISFFIGLVLLAFCRSESQPFIYFQF